MWRVWRSDRLVKMEQVVCDPRAEEKDAGAPDGRITVDSRATHQTIWGFGGAFNEIGWEAVRALPFGERMNIFRALFNAEIGCGFTLCRVPVGASDFALDAYSLNDVPGDFEMAHFSIERDRRRLIPYVREAMRIRPDLQIWASPWSPPGWMKTTGDMCGGGELIDRHEILKAYALYLLKFVQAYEAEGIPIVGIFPQNETDVINRYPTATFPEELMKKWMRGYLIPLFFRNQMKTEIWLGTIRSLPDYARTVLSDPVVRRFVKGIGFQYSRGDIVSEAYRNWSEKKILHTESPCHNGENSWEDAKDVFRDALMYLNSGSVNYCYWNMVLDETGLSSWYWRQNSLITVDRAHGRFRLNPEYYVMMHFSRFVRPGAVRIAAEAEGVLAEHVAAFRNPDGGVVLLAGHFTDRPAIVRVDVDGETAALNMEPDSIYTIRWDGGSGQCV